MAAKGDRDSRKKSGLYLFARDAGVAALFVFSILLAMFAYTGQWPPLVVVESNSMMHGTDNLSHIGTIDTGDLVLVQQVTDVGDLETYVDGVVSGHRTYGDYGDVIVYKVNGEDVLTPIIHRAIIYLEANSDGQSYRAESLRHLPDGKWELTSTTDSWDHITDAIIIHDVGWNDVDVFIDVGRFSGSPLTSGYITKGDRNPTVDQIHSSRPVHISWVVGKARGELPWFGLIKLWATDSLGSAAPPNSVRNLWISIAAIIVIPIIIDVAMTFKEKRDIERRRLGREGDDEPAGRRRARSGKTEAEDRPGPERKPRGRA